MLSQNYNTKKNLYKQKILFFKACMYESKNKM